MMEEARRSQEQMMKEMLLQQQAQQQQAPADAGTAAANGIGMANGMGPAGQFGNGNDSYANYADGADDGGMAAAGLPDGAQPSPEQYKQMLAAYFQQMGGQQS